MPFIRNSLLSLPSTGPRRLVPKTSLIPQIPTPLTKRLLRAQRTGNVAVPVSHARSNQPPPNLKSHCVGLASFCT
jgi:hypothetical protein